MTTAMERIKEINPLQFQNGKTDLLSAYRIQTEHIDFLLKAFRVIEKMLIEQILWNAYGNEVQAGKDFEERMKDVKEGG